MTVMIRAAAAFAVGAAGALFAAALYSESHRAPDQP
jgi:hypothetical protein